MKPNGARDKAAFLFYVLCARRRREVTELCGRDIRVEGVLSEEESVIEIVRLLW